MGKIIFLMCVNYYMLQEKQINSSLFHKESFINFEIIMLS